MQRLLKEDVSAYPKFIDIYQNFIFNIAKSLVTDGQLAEEITQDVFLKIFKSISSYKGEATLSTWIYRIAYTTSMNEVRKRKLILDSFDDFERQFDHLQSDDDWDNYLGEEDEIKVEINNAIKQLSKTDGLILSLFYLEGMKIDEISSILQTDKNTVKIKLYRSRIKIRNYLETKFKKHEKY